MIIQTKKYNNLIFTNHVIKRIQGRRNIHNVAEIKTVFIPELAKGRHRCAIRNGEEFIEIILHDGSKAVMRKEGERDHVLISFIDTQGFASRHFKGDNTEYIKRMKRARRKR